ncbi:DUF2953 domain-containing protein [Cohnella nanjingensis]|uniref:DUF2953 domain-containing protein n=1 Tax=Cohnella nanjingensis TaxID=1387779 RepID=A0A7X0RV08_9BACL|nr:DUF2953 domain-containing protein [Cohnella nanjingensis]MBB6674193.1 DUF2953 domain-containing protein [Cohnella nanjingensis]
MAFWIGGAMVCIVAVFAVAACLSHVRVRVRYSRSGERDQLAVVVRGLFGLVRIQKEIPSITLRGMNIVYKERQSQQTAGASQGQQEAKRKIGLDTIRRKRRAVRILLRSTRDFKTLALSFMRKVECTRWRLDVRIGTGDAALTGVAAGLFWTVIGTAIGLTGHFLKLRTHPHGSVSPNFKTTEFAVVWEADFRIRVGTAVLSVLRLGGRTSHFRQALRAWRSWMSPPEQA